MKKKVFSFFSSFFPFSYTILNSKTSLRIIYYHRINKKIAPYYFDTGISPSHFRKQLKHLTSRYKIISLTEAIEMTKNGIEFDNHFCVTFDDGFSECFNVIAPILEEFGIRAAFFLTEKCIDNNDMIWRNKLLVVEKELVKNGYNSIKQKFEEAFNIALGDNLLLSSDSWPMSEKDVMADFLWNEAKLHSIEEFLIQNKPYMTESQVFELISKGHDIGSHTYSHPYCHKLTKEEIDFEIINSAKRLSNRFSINCNLFSYPFGSTVSSDLENYILENSRLEMLFGIKDDLSNKQLKPRWERVVMERTFDDSLYSFYVTPNTRKLFTTKNKHH